MELNKIIQGDCLEVLKNIPDGSIDCLITDPPYNYVMNGGGSLGKKYDGYKKRVNDLGFFDVAVFLNSVFPKLKVFNAYVWCGKESMLEVANWAKDKKLNWNLLVWVKPNPLPAYNNTYLPDMEYCVFMREKNATFNNKLGYEKYRKAYIYKIGATGFKHPTVKPLHIISNHIQVSTQEGDLILDPFLGSGTTAVAAQNLNRNYIGIELNPEYIKIAENRLKQKPML